MPTSSSLVSVKVNSLCAVSRRRLLPSRIAKSRRRPAWHQQARTQDLSCQLLQVWYLSRSTACVLCQDVGSLPLESLSPDAGQPGMSKRGRKICHANFFKSGICQGQQLVCCVKTSALSLSNR